MPSRFAAATCVALLLAMPAAAQMPDPRIMSGQIIPSPELPAGTVTVRVIRQTIMNVAPGIDVELHGAGDVRHATTGPEGRAEFPGLPAGARVHAVAVVDGERLRSIEFDVPAAGGVRTMLAAGVGVGEMVNGGPAPSGAAAPAAPVASAPPVKPGQLAFANDTRFAVEFQDDTLAVFYLLDIVNPSSGPVALGEPLVIDLPADASGAGLLQGGSPTATVKGRRVTIAGTLPSGVTTVPVAYRIESWGGTWSLSQTFPLPIVDVALVVQKVGGMRLSSPSAPTVRDTHLQGTAFIMGTGASVPTGTPLQLTLSGLPHKSRVPVYVTLAIAGGLAVWGAWMAMSQSSASAAALAARRRELEGRRDRGLAALAALERRHMARALAEDDYIEERRSLVADLERVYSELDDRGGLPGGDQGLAGVIDFDQVTLTGVGRHYGRRRALHDVSFAMRAGEVVALVGPNGAGKSTLLSILSTLVTPTSGQVQYGSHTALSAGATLRQSIGWLGHDLQLYPELTARENLLFFAQLSGVAAARAAVDRALASADLVDRADDFVSSFSRGMRQRLALERALLHDPRLVLLDEPFTGLDRTSTGRLATRLGDLARQGRLVILATHDVLLPTDLIATAVSLRDGRLAGTQSGHAWATALRAAAPGDR